MIKVYTGAQGLAVSLFFIAGVVLFLSIFFVGVTKAIELLLPLLIVLSYLMIFIFLFVILPAAFFKNLRPSLYMYSVLMSHVLRVLIWMVAIVVILKGSWQLAAHLAVWIIFAYGMRFYSQWLLNLNSQKPKESDIIDVDAIEVR